MCEKKVNAFSRIVEDVNENEVIQYVCKDCKEVFCEIDIDAATDTTPNGWYYDMMERHHSFWCDGGRDNDVGYRRRRASNRRGVGK